MSQSSDRTRKKYQVTVIVIVISSVEFVVRNCRGRTAKSTIASTIARVTDPQLIWSTIEPTTSAERLWKEQNDSHHKPQRTTENQHCATNTTEKRPASTVDWYHGHVQILPVSWEGNVGSFDGLDSVTFRSYSIYEMYIFRKTTEI